MKKLLVILVSLLIFAPLVVFVQPITVNAVSYNYYYSGAIMYREADVVLATAINDSTADWSYSGVVSTGIWSSAGTYYVERGVLQFDTSSVPVGSHIEYANLTLTSSAPSFLSTTTTLHVTWCPAMTLTMNNTIYGYMYGNTTSAGSISTSGWSTDVSKTIDLNTYGLSLIIKGGTTVLGLMTSDDIAGVYIGETKKQFYTSSTPTKQPVLTVYYATNPSITTQAASNVGADSVTLNAIVNDDGDWSSEVRFQIGVNPGVYTGSTPWVAGYTTGMTVSAALSSILSGQPYYYVAEIRNPYGNVTASNEVSFTTLLNYYAPTGLTAVPQTYEVDLSWVKGIGTQKTLVLRKDGSYPTNTTDTVASYQVYLGTSSSITDTSAVGHLLVAGHTYYYRAWGLLGDGVTYTVGYTQDIATISYDVVPPSSTGITDQPGGLFTVPSSSNLQALPFYDIVAAAGVSMGIPAGNFWLLLFCITAAAFGIVTRVTVGSGFLAILVTFIAMIAGTVMGIAPLWMALYYFMLAGSAMYAMARG